MPHVPLRCMCILQSAAQAALQEFLSAPQTKPLLICSQLTKKFDVALLCIHLCIEFADDDLLKCCKILAPPDQLSTPHAHNQISIDSFRSEDQMT